MPKRKDPEINTEEYYELLSELFPSNYIKEKKNKLKEKKLIEYDDTYIDYIREKLNYLYKFVNHELLYELNNLHTLINANPIDKEEVNSELNKKLNVIIHILEKHKLDNNLEYKTLISNNNLNDDYYFKNLNNYDQEEILSKLKELNQINIIQKPYLIQILESHMPIKYKKIGMNKILQMKDCDNGENHKLIKWIDSFLKIPFNTPKYLPVTLNDGVDKCRQYMESCEQILNDCVYGMEEAKGQIMQLIGKWITNPQSIGTAIGLKGPMGTGKTTLVKNGISKILNRDFAFITLGGSVDGSTLKGHSYTYEGSTYGKIADILIQTKSSNPIIFFDELDKVSNKSDEIYSVLTHLTDTTQNTEFHDNYFSEIELNLSGCLFVFSYNDETLINPILRDRMYTIEIPGYNMKDKMHISYKHLLPSIVKDIGLTTHDIILNNDILSYIIEITKPEQGVRNLKRNLEIIYSKLNLFRILKTTTIFDKIFDVSFPFILNKETVDKLLKPYRQPESMNISTMYI